MPHKAHAMCDWGCHRACCWLAFPAIGGIVLTENFPILRGQGTISVHQSCGLDSIPNSTNTPTAPSCECGAVWKEGLSRWNQVKRRSWRVLVPCDCCPSEQRSFGEAERYAMEQQRQRLERQVSNTRIADSPVVCWGGSADITLPSSLQNHPFPCLHPVS